MTGEREKSIRAKQSTNIDCECREDGIPWRYLRKPFTPFFRVHIASLCNPMLSHCYLLLWRDVWERWSKKCFIHRFFIKHQPHDHLLHVSQSYPWCAREKRMTRDIGSDYKWNHLHLMILAFLSISSFSPDHLTRHTPPRTLDVVCALCVV